MVEVAFVGVAAVEDGAFDLDAEEVAPSVAVRSLRAGSFPGNCSLSAGSFPGNCPLGASYDEVVGGAVSAGAGEDESAFGGAELEAEFGPFSAEFGVRDFWAAVAHSCPLAAPEGANSMMGPWRYA